MTVIQTCHVCDSSLWKKRYTISDWVIDECEVCRFAKINPYPTDESRPTFFSQEKGYGKDFKKKRSFSGELSSSIKRAVKKITKRDKYDFFYKKLCRYLKPGSSVLDVACADATFIAYAKKRFKLTGIDIASRLIEQARKNNPEVDFLVGDYTYTDFGDKKFAGITLISLIEHLRDPIGAIQKSYDLLNEGGVLLLKTVNYASLNRIFMGKKWSGFRPPDHVVYFTHRNLEKALRKAGFRKVLISAFPSNDNMYLDAFK